MQKEQKFLESGRQNGAILDPREQVKRQINEAITSIRNVSDIKPSIGLVLGSGLSDVAEIFDVSAVIPYSRINHFPVSTVEGHFGNLVLGKIDGIDIVALQGRFHFYEGYTMWGISFPIRVLASLGIKNLILTSASGGINPQFLQDDIVVINDHINLLPTNPLIGPHIIDMGPRFVNMSEAYDGELRKIAFEAAEEVGIALKEGVYVAVTGPQYETPAEVNMLKKIGADVVGMSVVPEVIVSKQIGLKVLGLTVVTNDSKQIESLSHEQVLERIGKTRASFVKLLQAIVKKQSVN